MSSYRQKEQWMHVEVALQEAVAELRRLNDDMADLCAGIEAQFPATFDRIAKYRQAFAAWESLQSAVETADAHGDFKQLPATVGTVNIPLMVGKQTRQGRETSQRVRLGNARVRIAAALSYIEGLEYPLDAMHDLRAMLVRLDGVTFPVAFG